VLLFHTGTSECGQAILGSNARIRFFAVRHGKGAALVIAPLTCSGLTVRIHARQPGRADPVAEVAGVVLLVVFQDDNNGSVLEAVLVPKGVDVAVESRLLLLDAARSDRIYSGNLCV